MISIQCELEDPSLNCPDQNFRKAPFLLKQGKHHKSAHTKWINLPCNVIWERLQYIELHVIVGNHP